MKMLKQFARALAATAAICAITACQQPTSGVGTAATYQCTMEETTITDGVTVSALYTMSFYDDNTWVYHSDATTVYTKSATVVVSMRSNVDSYSGTYTGDPTTDSTVICTPTKAINLETMQTKLTALEEEVEAATASKTYTFTNADFPLEALSADEQEAYKVTLTISNGKATYNGLTYTRQ